MRNELCTWQPTTNPHSSSAPLLHPAHLHTQTHTIYVSTNKLHKGLNYLCTWLPVTPPLSAHTPSKTIAAVKTKRKRKTEQTHAATKRQRRCQRRCQSYSYEKYLIRKPINCKSNDCDAGSETHRFVWGRMRSGSKREKHTYKRCTYIYI